MSDWSKNFEVVFQDEEGEQDISIFNCLDLGWRF